MTLGPQDRWSGVPHEPVETQRIRTLDLLPSESSPGLPRDEALPALAALAATGMGAIPTLGLDGHPAGFILRGYTPGDRCAIEVRVSGRSRWRFAIKAYANDPQPEAELYTALDAAGLTSGRGARVPRLLAWDPVLKLIVLEWLSGSCVNDLVKDGPPERAGALGARWLRVAASLPVRLGPAQDATRVLDESGRFIAMLEDGDPALGAAGRALVESLSRSRPPVLTPRLVHGTLYTRHLIDTGDGDGDGPGVIDWQRFGQGPLELDAGTFLATLSRTALLRSRRIPEVHRATQAFHAETAGLLDERAVAWYQAAALLRLAGRMLRRRAPAQAAPLLATAAQLAEAAR